MSIWPWSGPPKEPSGHKVGYVDNPPGPPRLAFQAGRIHFARAATTHIAGNWPSPPPRKDGVSPGSGGKAGGGGPPSGH